MSSFPIGVNIAFFGINGVCAAWNFAYGRPAIATLAGIGALCSLMAVLVDLASRLP